MFTYYYNKISILILFISLFSERGNTEEWKFYHKDVADSHSPKRIALIVGINDFDDPFWPDLKFVPQ